VREQSVPVGVVAALGLTQVIGYGTLYYSFSVLAPGMAADLGITVAQVFAVFSASLFVGGLSAPYIGRQMDRVGAAAVMATGSVLSAMTLICAPGLRPWRSSGLPSFFWRYRPGWFSTRPPSLRWWKPIPGPRPGASPISR
jgi:sugar phosphate permease